MKMSWRDASHARKPIGKETDAGELLVLGRLVRESFPSGCKFSQFVPHHFRRDVHRQVRFAIVDHEFGTYEMWENSA